MFFFLAVAGYGAAVGTGAAMAWDGAWYLWRTVADGRPFVAHGRWANWPALAVVLQTSRSGALGPWGLARVDGALLALVPLGSLAVCWRVWRERWEPLRVWAALGVLLVPLPGQWALMSEATLVAQLCWPLLALAGAGRKSGPTTCGLLACAGLMWNFHPSSAVGFAVTAGALAWLRRRALAMSFGGLALARVAWAVWEATPYERGEVSAARVWAQWQTAVWGLPLVMLTGTGLLAVTVSRQLQGRLGGTRARAWLTGIGVVTGVAGAGWAADATRWGGLLEFRRWVLPAELPLLALAGWHGRRLARGPAADGEALVTARLAARWAAGIFALTLAVQSGAWAGLLARWLERIRQPLTPDATATGGRGFLAADELPFLPGTALAHWSACPLGLWLENGRPRRVFVLRRGDVRENGAAVQVTPWDALTLPAPPGTRSPCAAGARAASGQPSVRP